MRPGRVVVLAFFASTLLLWSAVPAVLSQEPSGHISVAADYEMFGISDLSGGGHVTWTFTGEQARLARAKILGLFDGYAQIPRGFPFAGSATGGDLNGVIDPDEGETFTSLLDAELEGMERAYAGTNLSYLQIQKSDLLEGDVPGALERSTAGLVGQDANSTQDLVIRFLFNARSRSQDIVMPLATRKFADVLEGLFSLEQVQSATLQAVGSYSGAWPLAEEGGWRIVTADDGRPALWAGNGTTGRYENAQSALMHTYADPARFVTPTDLRFATHAYLEASYTGQVFDANDVLRIEIATEPTFTNWVPLPLDGSLDVPTTPTGTWRAATYDLASYLGQRVRFQVNFTSDGSGSARGFFLRDFGIRAPSLPRGTIVESESHFVIGTLSFSDVAVSTGSVSMVRTPGGIVLLYSSQWNATAPPADQIRFQTFNAMENPQILFAVMLAAAYFISRSQESAYDRFRESHPSVYRPAVRKERWLHVLGRAMVLLLVLLYFVPSAFFFVGLRVFVSGPAFVFLALALALSLGFGTRAWYAQRLEEIPPPVAPEATPEAPDAKAKAPPAEKVPLGRCAHCLREIPDTDRTYRCSCGAVYHLGCASGMLRCPNCRKPMAVEVVRKKRELSMRCESCGEQQAVDEDVDPRTVTCPSCGGRLRHLDEGKGYLLLSSNPAIAFGWLKDLTRGGKPAAVLTMANPERLRLEFGLKGVTILEVSSEDPKGIDPRKLDPAALKAILPLFKEKKGGVLLYDGLEQIVTAASLGEVIPFLRKANDMAFVHGVTVVARVAPGTLAESELDRLRPEFEESIDLSARL